MFELEKQILENIRHALKPMWEPALEGPQIYNMAPRGGGCMGTCKHSCRGDCKGSCQGGCTRSCKGHSR